MNTCSCRREDLKAVEQSQWLGDVPEDWKRADTSRRVKRGIHRNTGWSVSCWSLEDDSTILLESISKHMKTRRWLGVVSMDLWSGNHTSSTWQPSFYNKLAGLVEEWRESHVLQLVKSLANVFVSQNTLKDNLIKCRLDKWLVSAMDWDVAELPGTGLWSVTKPSWCKSLVVGPRGPVLFNIFINVLEHARARPSASLKVVQS